MTPDGLTALRAFVEAVCPGLDSDGSAGAPDIAADRYVAHYLGEAGIRMLAQTLGDEFAGMGLAERASRIASLRRLPGERPVVDRAVALTLAAVYGSWSGSGPSSEAPRAPLGWQLAGYPGAVRTRLADLDR